jgi:hypothetical protein
LGVVTAGKRAGARALLVALPPGSDARRQRLLADSGLPGPRANLELLDAAGDVLTREEALLFAALGPDATPAGTALEFLPCCGMVALGRLVADGDVALVARLREAAGDPRWRVRESVAIALQRWGDSDPAAMTAAIAGWPNGTLYEARAAVAAVSEPRLLRTPPMVEAAARVLDGSTRALVAVPRPRGEPGRVLGAALGYGWSVAIAASPSVVLPAFERWVPSDDPDVRRMVKENLAKARFARAAPDAVRRLSGHIPRPTG